MPGDVFIGGSHTTKRRINRTEGRGTQALFVVLPLCRLCHVFLYVNMYQPAQVTVNLVGDFFRHPATTAAGSLLNVERQVWPWGQGLRAPTVAF